MTIYIARRLLLFILLLFLFIRPERNAAASLADENDANAATQALALVNQWRIAEGLSPLKNNKTLEAMAIAQAIYIKPKVASISDDDEAAFHLDGQGHTPAQRAVLAPYNWPTYGKARSAQTLIGENAAVNSPAGALSFWQSSPVHTRAALNPIYREVGVAAVAHPFGYVFIMDFGARPNVLTALASPLDNTLYLTNENSAYAALRADAMRFRLFNADGSPLTDTLPWQPTYALPKGLSSTIFVLYTNSAFQSLVAVNLVNDLVTLPTSQAIVSAITPTVSPTPTRYSPTATEFVPTVRPVVSTTSTATQALPTLTATSSSSATVPTPTGSADLLLTYNSRSMFILNTSTKPLNLTGLSIGGSGSRVAIETFTATATFPVSAFPAGHCLQIELIGATDKAPSSCRYVRSVINVSLPKVFWIQGSFTVMQNEVVIATCQATASECRVVLSKGSSAQENSGG